MTGLAHCFNHISPLNRTPIFPRINFIVLSRFPHFSLYHGFPRRAMESPRIDWLGRGGKKRFPFLVVTSLWLLYILLITHHDRLSHLFYSSLAVFSGREGEESFSNPHALLLLLSSSVQASRQSSAFFSFFVLEPARSIHIFLFLKWHRKAFFFKTTFA